jgi:hypothetical protein
MGVTNNGLRHYSRKLYRQFGVRCARQLLGKMLREERCKNARVRYSRWLKAHPGRDKQLQQEWRAANPESQLRAIRNLDPSYLRTQAKKKFGTECPKFDQLESIKISIAAKRHRKQMQPAAMLAAILKEQ